MPLTARQHRALQAICDTFAPGGQGLPASILAGLPSASELGVPAAIARALEEKLPAAEKEKLARLLSFWDSRLNSLLAGAGWHRFSALDREQRQRILLDWCESSLVARRAAFQALRRAVLGLCYMLPGPGGGPNPAWQRMRYPGPLGPPANPPQKRIQPLRIEQNTTLECDVCVIGSGAGGGTAAGVLAAAGLDVVVLEAGDYYDDADFDGSELSGLSRMYWQGAAATTADQGVVLLAGECLGGGTVINYTTSFRTPDEVRQEWAAEGVPAFAGNEYTRSLDAVCARLGVNQTHNRPAARERVVERGLRALGWHVDTMPRNVQGCDQGVSCGYCGFGCRLGAKQSTVKTWLADAFAAGVRILVNTRAERILVERGAARGVVARHRPGGFAVRVNARAVVVACGAPHTPVLLKRSGLGNADIGRHLHLHPVTAVWGVFDEEIRPWEGTMQALYSDQHRCLTGSYGVKYETTAEHPGLAATLLPWRGAQEHSELMTQLSHAVGIGVLLRDRDAGTVEVGPDGGPVARYTLSEFDRNHMRAGVGGAARILEAAGARKIFSSHARWVGYAPGRQGTLEQFCREADAAGWGPGECAYASFHIMGTARMGGSPARSACNPEGEAWEARNLVVADASAFPSASGVNPMITIEAIAHLNASQLAARLK